MCMSRGGWYLCGDGCGRSDCIVLQRDLSEVVPVREELEQLDAPFVLAVGLEGTGVHLVRGDSGRRVGGGDSGR